MNLKHLLPLLLSQLFACRTNAFQITRSAYLSNVKSSNNLCKSGTPLITRNASLLVPSKDSFASRTTSNLQMATSDEASEGLTTPLDKPALAAVDFISLVIFAGVGKASHSADGSLDIQAVLTTAFPFLLAWFATSPLTGVYGGKNDGVLDAGKLAAKGWILAIPLGCVLRGLIKGYVPPLPFVIVTMIATLVLLGGSRMLYSVVEDKMSEEA